MTQLKQQKFIPSVSFGYTAGAPYRRLRGTAVESQANQVTGFTGVLSSLTLGGYDSSRFTASEVEFSFAADNERDTVVAIQSITTSAQNDTATNVDLLPSPIYALVDTTVPQIWLPIEACQRFEEEFGLLYDNTTDLYLVNSSLHASLLQRGANVSFTLARATSGGPVTTITLPYSAFDLTALPPYQGISDSSAYFPLRRAQNSTQYTLGRTFMQEAYVTVDYERAKFNVSQCVWDQDMSAQLVPIHAAGVGDNSQYSGAGPVATQPLSSSTLSGGAIGGIVAGAIVGVAILASLIFWYLRRKRIRQRQDKETGATKASQSSSSRDSTLSTSQTMLNEKGTTVFPKAELEGSTMQVPDSVTMAAPGTPTTPLGESTIGGYSTHMSTSTTTTAVMSPISPGLYSLEAGGDQVFEMPGDMPVISQADGRQITEKDMMRKREQVYNGVDPHASQETQAAAGAEGPLGEHQPRRLVQPGEVVLRDVVNED